MHHGDENDQAENVSGRAVRVGRIDVLEHDGLLLDVRDCGPRDGDAVVLLHGFPQDSRCWDSVTPHLHRAGFRTLALDQRGYSPKGSPSEISAYRIEALAADVLRLLDEAGLERAHIVGHDWGGALAWHLGAHHAARVATLTVLSTPHPQAFAWSLLRSAQGLRSWYAVAVQVPVLPELVLGATLAPALRLSGLPKETAQRYGACMANASDLTGPLNWYRASARHALMGLPHLPGGNDAEIIHAPTTYLWGRSDPALGRTAAHRTEQYVDAEYRFVELDAGHWLPETEPAAVAREVVLRATAASPPTIPVLGGPSADT